MSDSESPLNAVRALVDAMNSGDQQACLATMAEGVIIVDDIPPFRVTGQDAARQWLRRAADARTRLNASLTLDDADVRVAQNRAYVVAPGHLKGSATAGSFDIGGVLSSTLEERDGKWLVDTLVWSSQR